MKNRVITLAALTATVLSFTAIGMERVPAPNEENCSGAMYEHILASLSNQPDRNEFVHNCKSFHEARKMTEWTFKKSPPDDF
ncbi:entry exclusion lipoprotein TrbK [Pseudomonas alabamensis]|jgi:entry exclusion lipoprotein TrbK|uniref:entry exclusion lipoprotein TrbK n=1 Tax=Pseudomonas alabamensis TaxID=3064349 RepID=UPI000745AE4D|nr:entry exclusion lipoprotein TrbK [Pseudomonas monteilii]